MTSNTAAPVRVYVDSCGIIAFLLGEKPTSEAVQALLDQAEEGEIEIVVSAAILAEVRRRDTYDKAAAAKIDDLLMTTRRGILRRPMSITVGVIAREIGSKYGLSPMDALHLAVALHERVSVFYTTDGAEKPPRRKPKALLALNGKEIEWDDPVLDVTQIRRLRIEVPKLWTAEQSPLIANVEPLPLPPPAPPKPDPKATTKDETSNATSKESAPLTGTADGGAGAKGPDAGGPGKVGQAPGAQGAQGFQGVPPTSAPQGREVEGPTAPPKQNEPPPGGQAPPKK